MSTAVVPTRVLNTLATKNNPLDWATRRHNSTVKAKKEALIRSSATSAQPPSYVAASTSIASASPKTVVSVTNPVPPQVNTTSADTNCGTPPRRVYSREFLLKMKDHPSCAKPPTPSPCEAMIKYNEDHEIRERTTNPPSAPLISTAPFTISSPLLRSSSIAVDDDASLVQINSMPGATALSSKPMFSPISARTPIPAAVSSPRPTIDQNKENVGGAASFEASSVRSPRLAMSSNKKPVGSGKPSAKPVPSLASPSQHTSLAVQKPKPDIISVDAPIYLGTHTLSPYPSAGPVAPPNTPVHAGELPVPPPYHVTLSIFQATLGALSNFAATPGTPPSAGCVAPSPISTPSVIGTPLASVVVSPPYPMHPHAFAHSVSPRHVASLNTATSPRCAPVTLGSPASPEAALDVVTARMTGVLRESDGKRLCNRQKQIDYGKATTGYQRYTELVPRNKRRREDPKTPNRYQVCSKRSWDGQVRKWRRLLHLYDPPGTVASDDVEMDNDSENDAADDSEISTPEISST